MEKEQVQDLTDFEKLNIAFNKLNDDDFRKVQLAINLLLFKRGVIDGSFESDNELYRFVVAHFEEINSYFNVMGLRLMLDTTFLLAWVDLVATEERVYSPFSICSMNANQLILLAVLQKRFATKNSSENLGIEDSFGVLLTEFDIVHDMYLYMKDSDDEVKKYKDAVSAIKLFCDDLGLLRLIWEDRVFSDGSSGKVYRVSPFIGHQFNAEEMDTLISSVRSSITQEVKNG